MFIDNENIIKLIYIIMKKYVFASNFQNLFNRTIMKNKLKKDIN
jgi:hypothetical protein